LLNDVKAVGALLTHDLVNTAPIVPEIDYDQAPFRADEVGFSLRADGEGAVGIALNRAGSWGEQIEMAVFQAQDWVIELLAHKGRSPVWPECAMHPGSHPLTVTVADGAAVWICPRTSEVIAVVGSLGTR
jgi:hypothetical protein